MIKKKLKHSGKETAKKMLQIIATNPRQIQKVIDTAKCPKQAITLARDYQTLFGTKWEIGIKQ